MNLYELSHNYQELLDLMESVDTTDPNYAQALTDTLDSIGDAIDDKAEGYVMVANQLQHDIAMVKDEISRLSDKQKALQNNLSKLKDTLVNEMQATGKEKIKTPRFTIWVQNNPQSLKIMDERNIPFEFYIPQAPKLNKRELLKHVKSHPIDGVEITQEKGLRFR